MVGATSRPDLLDAALLRPGRLDRLLLCGFPGAEERIAITRALARRLRLAPDAQLDAMAAGAEGFTGGRMMQPAYEVGADLTSVDCHPLLTNELDAPAPAV